MTGKDILKITLNLVVIYIVGGLILAFVYAKTSPVMFRNALQEKEAALNRLFPEADAVERLGEWYIHDKHAEYFVARRGDTVIGYIIQSFGKGYSSYINTLIAVDTDFRVRKIDVLGHAETPGLGDEIEADSFKDQFIGKDREHLTVLKTDTSDFVQAISGATISSRAVAEDAVKNGLEFIMERVKEKGTADGAGRSS